MGAWVPRYVAALTKPHPVQKSENEKRQKDADDCVKQTFFSKDHVTNAAPRFRSHAFGTATAFGLHYPWRWVFN
jgi:hypothetical protein